MAVILTTNTTIGINVSASGDTYITREGFYVAADTDAFDFVDFDNLEYFIEGDVFAGDDGIVASTGANNNDISIGFGASVQAGGDGIQFFGNTVSDSGHDFVNNGSIVGLSGEGVDVRASFSSLINYGSITGFGFGVFYSGTGNSVRNHGTVSSASTGIGLSGSNGEIRNFGGVIAESNGLDVSGGDYIIHNAGNISVGSIGIDAGSGSGNILNAGNILASIGVRMSAPTDSIEQNGRLTNSGEIHADSTGIDIVSVDSVDVFRVVNSGLVSVAAPDGDALSGGGSVEILVNTGTLIGDVTLNGGDDVYFGTNGRVIGVVDGGAGDDILRGGDEDNDLDGGTGDDMLRGGGGDDELRGSAGHDELRGDAGDDLVSGGGGHDLMFGGLGDDDLKGFGGDDTLNGGQGDDLLSGGSGADVFQFYRNAGEDRIWDFQNGTDKIDMTAFSVFFSDINAAMTSRWGNAIIDLDALGGSGTIIVNGAAGALDASDFIL
ncbi:calcium-binding protein [Algicella marina]|uniref:Calcium-binding protein n=1 Tax=Algicella marina TaxID=2683284 RepID=A0A6P1SZJ9_9RHOB|nr:calcium-binding protein [Algicella marina]QHQ36104.1 hypothetical protein GO499_13445 [Algicella marina]